VGENEIDSIYRSAHGRFIAARFSWVACEFEQGQPLFRQVLMFFDRARVNSKNNLQVVFIKAEYNKGYAFVLGLC